MIEQDFAMGILLSLDSSKNNIHTSNLVALEG